jgi:hypothetical protein
LERRRGVTEVSSHRGSWVAVTVLAIVLVVGALAASSTGSHADNASLRSDLRKTSPGSHLKKAPPRPLGRPRLVYASPDDQVGATRHLLQSAWIDRGSSVGVSFEQRVQAISFVVDEPVASTSIYAVDNAAPFVLPRRGRAGKSPYALGPHTLLADVELRSHKRLRLRVDYTVASTLHAPATSEAASLERAIAAMPPGPVIVRPARDQASFEVVDDMTLRRPSVSIERARLAGLEFAPESSGSRLVRSSAMGFGIRGADDIVLDDNAFDGKGLDPQNTIWDAHGDVPDGWIIRNNTFQNYYLDDGESHSEALFVGYSAHGLIENNVFTNNGNTAHIFFTWFGDTADPTTSYPRDICVRGNVFNRRHTAFFDVNFREEIPSTAHITVQANATSSRRDFSGAC